MVRRQASGRDDRVVGKYAMGYLMCKTTVEVSRVLSDILAAVVLKGSTGICMLRLMHVKFGK